MYIWRIRNGKVRIRHDDRKTEKGPQDHCVHGGHRRAHPGGQRPPAGRHLAHPRPGGQGGGGPRRRRAGGLQHPGRPGAGSRHLRGYGRHGGQDGGAAQGQDDRGGVPQKADAGQLLRHHAGEDGGGRLPAGRRHLLHRRHRPPRPPAYQDQAGQQDRLLLLHPGPPLRHR